MQQDGNLVVYYGDQADPIWSAVTAGNPGATASMQTDGNLVVYSAAGAALWASDSSSTPGAFLILQTDGNLVVYGNNPGGIPYPAWASNTEDLRGHQLQPGEVLQPSQYLESENGQYTLSMSPTGYLVEAVRGTYACPLWTVPSHVAPTAVNSLGNDKPFTTYAPHDLAFHYQTVGGQAALFTPPPLTGITATSPTPNAYLAMQTDGNLVLYAQGNGGSALWASATSGHPSSYLKLQTDGNVVVYATAPDGGAALWSAGTNGWRGTQLCTEESLKTGQYLSFTGSGSPSGPELEMQATCNLVLYENTAGSRDPIWASNTDVFAQYSPFVPGFGCYAVLQDDGNLVVYGTSNGAIVVGLWSSGTSIGSTAPPTGRPFVGPFWVQLFNPYVLMQRWGVGTAWKADPETEVPGLGAKANTVTVKKATNAIGDITSFLTTTGPSSLQGIFESFGWL
jgi:hypothetical protein